MKAPAEVLLLRSGFIHPDQIRAAKALQEREGGALVECLVRLEFINEEQLADFYHKSLIVPRLTPRQLLRASPVAIKTISGDLAHEFQVLPLKLGDDETMTVAMADPSDTQAIEEVSFFSGYFCQRAVAPLSAVRDSIAHYYFGGPKPAFVDEKAVQAAGPTASPIADLPPVITHVITTMDGPQAKAAAPPHAGPSIVPATASPSPALPPARPAPVSAVAAPAVTSPPPAIAPPVPAIAAPTDEDSSWNPPAAAPQFAPAFHFPSTPEAPRPASPQAELLPDGDLLPDDDLVPDDDLIPDADVDPGTALAPTPASAPAPAMPIVVAPPAGFPSLSAFELDPSLEAQGEPSISRVIPVPDFVRQALRAAVDRDQVANILLDFAALFAGRSALLVVRQRSLSCFAARGLDLSPAGVEEIKVSLELPSVFRDVVQYRIAFRGLIPMSSEDPAWPVPAMFSPGELILLPIALKDRVVAVLWSDLLHASPSNLALDDLSREAANAFERVIRARKS